jgi:ribosomal protein S18 acetylase RimI-like enzyme
LRVAEKIPLSTTSSSDEAVHVAFSMSLRPVHASDEVLLQRIFAESHCAGFELMGLEPAALAGLIGMQFRARQAQYRGNPDAIEYLIYGGSGPDAEVLGSCWLGDTAGQLRVLDIAVLTEHRRRGVARAVLTALCARAATAGKPVGLSVWHDNAPARELYRALGFVPDPAVGGNAPGDLGNGYLELRHSHDPADTHLRVGAR